MAILALDWYVWVALGALFAYALGRRLVRSWQARRRARRGAGAVRPAQPSWATRAGRLYGSKRP